MTGDSSNLTGSGSNRTLGRNSLIRPDDDAARPSLLMTIYANPDYFPPTRYAASILSRYFKVTIVCRNVGEPSGQWPREIAIERAGSGGSEDYKIHSNPIDKLLELREFMAAVRAAVARIRPALIYAYEPHAFCAALGASRRIRTTPLIFQLHELPEIDVLPWHSLQTWVIRRALRETASASLVVFPERNRAKIWLRAAGDARQPLIVPNCPALGFSPDGCDVAALVERRWAQRKAVHFGAMGEHNGQGEAVQSLTHLPSTISLQMVGKGTAEYRETLVRLGVQLGLQARLSIGDFIEHARLTD
ncbi:MAG: hypothetical protein ACREQB_05685, partial [Candidatus Binataceae bacterium]